MDYNLLQAELLLCASDVAGHKVNVTLIETGVKLTFTWLKSVTITEDWRVCLAACIEAAEATDRLVHYPTAEIEFCQSLAKRFSDQDINIELKN